MLKRVKTEEALEMVSSALEYLNSYPHYTRTPTPAFTDFQALLRQLLPCLSIVESLSAHSDSTTSIYGLVSETLAQIIERDALAPAAAPTGRPETEAEASAEPVGRGTGDGGHDEAATADASSATAISVPKVHWSDIHGCAEAILELKQATLLPQRFPRLFAAGSRRRWQRILLYGPPGTGKTLLACATAAEHRAPFLNLSSADLLSKWVGESEKQVRQAFQQAAGYASCVVFLDEIDALCSARGGGGETEMSRRLKTEFLLHLQNLGPGVVVLAATNMPWEIDSAIRRRFDHSIYVPLPSTETRREIIHTELASVPHRVSAAAVRRIARQTAGYSSSDVVQLVSQAAMGPMRDLVRLSSLRVATAGETEAYFAAPAEITCALSDCGDASCVSSSVATAPRPSSEAAAAAAPTAPSPSSSAAAHKKAVKPIVLPQAAAAAAKPPHRLSEGSDAGAVLPARRSPSEVGEVFYVLCEDAHPGALKHLTVSCVDESRLLLPLVLDQHFAQALRHFVPSVTKAELERFDEWRNGSAMHR